MSGWNLEQAAVVAEIHRLLQEYHSKHHGEFQAQHAVFAEILFRAGVLNEAQRNKVFEVINADEI